MMCFGSKRQLSKSFRDVTGQALSRGSGAHVGEGSFEEDFFDGSPDVLPNVHETASLRVGAGEAAFLIPLQARRGDDATVHNLQDCANGDLGRWLGQQITTMNTPAAGNDATAAEFQENLFEILDGNFVAGRDLMDGSDFRVLRRKVEDGAGRVFAFG